MAKLFTSLGLMSGTSGDGVDASLITTDGKEKFDLKRFRKEHPDMYENYCDENYKIKIEVEK